MESLKFTAHDAGHLSLDWFKEVLVSLGLRSRKLTTKQAESLKDSAVEFFAEYRDNFKDWDNWQECLVDRAEALGFIK